MDRYHLCRPEGLNYGNYDLTIYMITLSLKQSCHKAPMSEDHVPLQTGGELHFHVCWREGKYSMKCSGSGQWCWAKLDPFRFTVSTGSFSWTWTDTKNIRSHN